MSRHTQRWNAALVFTVLLVLGCGGGGGGGGGALPATAAADPEGVTETSARICATVDPRGAPTTAWFEWGLDPALGVFDVTPGVEVGPGGGAVRVEADLAGLAPGTTWFYRVAGENRHGTARSDIATFATVPASYTTVVVNTLEDPVNPPPGIVSLREAIRLVIPAGTITFDPALSGGTIALDRVAEEHTPLKGEVFTIGPGGWQFQGFLPRDYGRSALFAAKSVVIDASALPGGIALEWTGGDANPARLLAVHGHLTLRHVAIRNGVALAESIAEGDQPYTLGRGGGLAVWGIATLEHCTVSGCRAEGDPNGSRDRGGFGGGIYANSVVLVDSIVSGNSARGYGSAGGGVYSVGGAEGLDRGSRLARCVVSGNRVTGQHAYGGGIYSDGGGPGNLFGIDLTNCTVSRNLVEDHPDLAESPFAQYYYRGGGLYMSNGFMNLTACTVVENEVTGHPAVFSGKPNMGGGGFAATIGNAHVVEHMRLRATIVAGNLVGGQPGDVYTGSIRNFVSHGYNLVGVLDVSQILVPVPPWESLSRKHWPKAGDRDGVTLAEAVDTGRIRKHDTLLSVGADAGEPAVLAYPPAAAARDRIPAAGRDVEHVLAEYSGYGTPDDDFLNHVLAKIRELHSDVLGADFGEGFGDLTGVTFLGPAITWPQSAENAPWIGFWRDLDAALDGRLGPIGLGDSFWGSFTSGPVGNGLVLTVKPVPEGPFRPVETDQSGLARPVGAAADVGAVEE